MLGTELAQRFFQVPSRSQAAKVKDKGKSPGLEPGQDLLLFSVWNSSWLRSSFSVGFSPQQLLCGMQVPVGGEGDF